MLWEQEEELLGELGERGMAEELGSEEEGDKKREEGEMRLLYGSWKGWNKWDIGHFLQWMYVVPLHR